MDKKRIIKVAICSFISAIIWCTVSKCFAVTAEWDLSTEKETYIEIADYYNSGYTTPFDSYVKSEYMQPAFIESLFSTAEQKLNETTRLRENAPYCVVKFQTTTSDGANEIRLYFCSDIQIPTNTLQYVTYNTFYLKYYYKNGLLTYDNIYSWSSGTTTFTNLVNITGYSSGDIEGFLLSNFSGLKWSSSYDPYASKTMWAETYIAENLMQFNPTLNYNNNLLLNIDVIKGDDITYDYDFFYYDENENRVSVKDKISYKSSSLWYGDLYGFYISKNVISQFPNDTDFYMYIKYRPSATSSYTISENTMLAFKTLSSITNPDAGGDTGGEDTPGGDTGGGTSVDLGNIENTLGDINTSIIEVGTQTNQNLNEIQQAIQQTNELIIQEPTTSKDEFSESFPTVEIDDPSEDFFTWIFENIENVFLSTEEQVFEFSLYSDTVYTVSSNQITVPNSTIKTLVGLSIDFGICYWILKDVRKTINKVKEGNIESLADDDITANMV